MVRTNTSVRFTAEELERVRAYVSKRATKENRNVSLSDVVRELVARGLKEAERNR